MRPDPRTMDESPEKNDAPENGIVTVLTPAQLQEANRKYWEPDKQDPPAGNNT